MRSTPMPNANPLIFAGSYARLPCACHETANTAGSTMPQPSSSIQPDCLHLRQPLPAAENAADLHVRAGLSERKEAGKESRLHPRPEQRLHRVVQRSLQVGEGDVRCPRTAPPPGGRPANASRRPRRCDAPCPEPRSGSAAAAAHRPDLHRRRVRAHQQPVAQRLSLLPGQHQRVLRVARGMVRREIQRLEVVEVALHLRPQRGRVAQMMKHPTISFIVFSSGCSAPGAAPCPAA